MAVEDEDIKIFCTSPETSRTFHQLEEIYILHKHIALVKGNKNVIGNLMDNMIRSIINHNLILTTKVNSIVVIT